jgi:hypothetical protein
MASTRYLEISAQQSPISIGNDAANRAMLSFNILCMHVGSPGTLEEDICKIIQDAGLATLGTNMWFGSLAKLPEGTSAVGPYVSIIAYGGLAPHQTHNGDKLSRPSVQIITRAASYVVARNKANAVHSAVSGKHNITVTQ